MHFTYLTKVEIKFVLYKAIQYGSRKFDCHESFALSITNTLCEKLGYEQCREKYCILHIKCYVR